MLGDNHLVKIIDFGNSRIVGSHDATGALGTVRFVLQRISKEYNKY
jgi:hypothetical protein